MDAPLHEQPLSGSEMDALRAAAERRPAKGLTLLQEREASRKRMDAQRAEELKRIRMPESYGEFLCGKYDPSLSWEDER